MTPPGSGGTLDLERLRSDRSYRRRLARRLLDACEPETDHVELRRVAKRVFPPLARARARDELARIVGSAATIRQRSQRVARAKQASQRKEAVKMPPSEPLEYADEYCDLDEQVRSRLIGVCNEQIEDGKDGPRALESLRARHGWPYSDKTFYVGPWKAARLRRRKKERSSAGKPEPQLSS